MWSLLKIGNGTFSGLKAVREIFRDVRKGRVTQTLSLFHIRRLLQPCI